MVVPRPNSAPSSWLIAPEKTAKTTWPLAISSTKADRLGAADAVPADAGAGSLVLLGSRARDRGHVRCKEGRRKGEERSAGPGEGQGVSFGVTYASG